MHDLWASSLKTKCTRVSAPRKLSTAAGCRRAMDPPYEEEDRAGATRMPARTGGEAGPKAGMALVAPVRDPDFR